MFLWFAFNQCNAESDWLATSYAVSKTGQIDSTTKL